MQGQFGYGNDGKQGNGTRPLPNTAELIRGAVQGVGPTGAPTGGLPVVPTLPTVTPNIVPVGASASGSIPAGAKGWTFVVLTGTASLGAATGLPAGFSDSDPNTTGAAIPYTTSSASSAYVRYGS